MNFEKWFKPTLDKLPPTALLKLFGLARIPLLFAAQPKVLRLSHASAEIVIPLNYVTKNHVGSMYFGALSIGADCIVAILALEIAKLFPDHKIVPIFKDFHADFVKRAESDVTFICTEGEKIKAVIEKAITTGERVTESIKAYAILAQEGPDAIAHFSLGLSVKVLPVNGNR